MSENPVLNVGLLLCDDVDESARKQYGTYTKMFRQGLADGAGETRLTPFRCHENAPLPAPGDYDGYIISGSRYSVYEDLPWIAALKEFVVQCRQKEIRTVGVCFGHQLIAQALGGKAEKAGAGWGFGIHTAKITDKKPWMTDIDELNGDSYNLIVIHQDQVVGVPEGFKVIAENEFCPNSMMAADDKMLGIQGHPEFNKAFCAFRARCRRELIGEDVYRATLDSLARNNIHSGTIMKWINNFLHYRRKPRQDAQNPRNHGIDK